MNVEIKNPYTYYHELRSRPDASGIPLSSANVTEDLAELVDEVYTLSVLAERLPRDLDAINVEVMPDWSVEPAVGSVDIRLSAGSTGSQTTDPPQPVVRRRFDTGPWVRSAQESLLQLRDNGTLGEDETAYRLLTAVQPAVAAECEVPIKLMQPPPVVAQSLAELGVREITDGSLAPDRPVLVNARVVDEAITRCEAAGPNETGGAVLGKIIRLAEPLPQTTTRIVTILMALITDSRHTGELTRFHISPEALAEAAEIADMRGLGESVLTVFHTHGWGCGDCNQKECPLAECFPSLHDYELEALFPTKALLLPIAGRKLGAEGRRPILQVHAWQGGQMSPIRWQKYVD